MNSQQPTRKQLNYLRALANQTATTFVSPRDRREASREIERLCRLPRREVEEAGGEDPPASSHMTARQTVPARRLAGYRELAGGRDREVLELAVPGARLVVDRVARGGDARLVARLDLAEPARNAEIVTELYLADRSRGCCRLLTREDLEPPRPVEEPLCAAGDAWRAPLVAGVGAIICLRALATRSGTRWVRWTRARIGCATVTLSLRDVVGELEDYEAPVRLTREAIRANGPRCELDTSQIQAELRRLLGSPLVLNRRLRERVLREVGAGEVSMNEIAIRCGRVKRNGRRAVSGETSWLARRIGLMPEGGGSRPTPWVHSDVLALIARDGLGVSPREVEL